MMVLGLLGREVDLSGADIPHSPISREDKFGIPDPEVQTPYIPDRDRVAAGIAAVHPPILAAEFGHSDPDITDEQFQS